jgi:hypothetical protein
MKKILAIIVLLSIASSVFAQGSNPKTCTEYIYLVIGLSSEWGSIGTNAEYWLAEANNKSLTSQRQLFAKNVGESLAREAKEKEEALNEIRNQAIAVCNPKDSK